VNEWIALKIGGTLAGSVGAYAAIIAKKDVSKPEAWAIFLVGICFAFFLPTLIATKVILAYGLINNFENLFGIVGILGLLFGLIGYKLVSGIYKLAGMFEKSPIPFLQKLLGLWSNKP